jgi:hypothetical protein
MLRTGLAPDHLKLFAPEKKDTLYLSIPGMAEVGAVTLTLDAYRLENPVHPEGHFGWWTFDIAAGEKIGATLVDSQSGLTLKVDGLSGAWVNEVNPDPSGVADILLHVVLRHRVNNRILSQQSLVAYRSAASLAAAQEAANGYLAPRPCLGAERPRFNWPRSCKVHLVAQSLPAPERLADRPEAVTVARLIRQHGIECCLYATHFDPRLRGLVRSTREMLDRSSDSDIILVFYDGREQNLGWLSKLPQRKAFVFLGIPESRRLQPFDAEAYRDYGLALRESGYACHFDIVAASSAEAGRSLARLESLQHGSESGSAQVLSARLFKRDVFWSGVGEGKIDGGLKRFLLYRSRLVPYNDLVSTLHLFDKIVERDPELHLVVASTRANSVYHRYIDYLLTTRFKSIHRHVHIRSDLSDSDLKALLVSCSAMIDIGPSLENHADDAVLFDKLLFVGPQAGSSGDRSSSFRLYGAVEDQAEAVLSALRAGQAPGRPEDSDTGEAQQIGLWDILERLVALPIAGGPATVNSDKEKTTPS